MDAKLAETIAEYAPSQVFVLCDANVERLAAALPELASFPRLSIQATEENKSLLTVQQIWDFLFDHHATRRALLINFGGGIVCDLGGFAAATYQRGIDFIHIPTTLLAMADAAIGGKTGCNYRGLKNQIGLIRAPKCVIINKVWLSVLPEQQLRSGFAEILKCSLLDSEASFYACLSDLEEGQYARHLTMAIAVKERYVQEDEMEQGPRKMLNLGHTIGHAIEEQAQRHHTPIPHGYCVLYGLVGALYLSVVKCGLDKQLLTLLAHAMISYYGRPQCNCKEQEQLLQLMAADKKNDAEHIRFVLLKHPGDGVYDVAVSHDEIREALDYLFSL